MKYSILYYIILSHEIISRGIILDYFEIRVEKI